MQGIIWGFTYIFTQYVKRPDDPDQYRTGYEGECTYRIRSDFSMVSALYIYVLRKVGISTILELSCAKWESKKISNDQELIQSDPISCPQNQKGNN